MNENLDSNKEVNEASQTDPTTTTETADSVNGDGNSTLDVRADAETAQNMTNFDNEGVDGATSPMTIADVGNTTNDIAKEAVKAMALKAESDRVKREQEDAVERAIFAEDMTLRLDSVDSNTPIIVDVDKDLIVGRADNVTAYTPEIDLTPHGAYRLGLSRRHALIRRKDDGLIVKDLSSRNGTYVNGEQVLAGNTLPLRDGDEIRFGNLAMRVRFEHKS